MANNMRRTKLTDVLENLRYMGRPRQDIILDPDMGWREDYAPDPKSIIRPLKSQKRIRSKLQKRSLKPRPIIEGA